MSNFKFIFISSYGYDSYTKLLRENIEELDNVEIQTKFLQFNQYLQFLSQFKFAVLIPVRPQGLGILSYLLYFKCTIYTYKTSHIKNYLDQFGLKYKLLHDNSILSQLREKDLDHNKYIIENEFSYAKCLKQWNQLES